MKNQTQINHHIDTENLVNLFEDLKNNTDKSVQNLLFEAEKLSDLSNESNQLELQCEILIYLGRGYRLTEQSFKAISSLNKAHILVNSKFTHRKVLLAEIYRELGNVYSNNLKDYLTSIDYLFKGYSQNVSALNSTFLNNIGSNYNSLGQYNKAAKFIRKGIKEAKKNNNHVSLAFLKFNLADNITKSGNPQASVEIYLEALKLCEEIASLELAPLDIANANYIYAYSFEGISISYLLIDELDKAKEYLRKGKEVSINTKQSGPLSSLYLLQGRILLKENKNAEYHKLAKESIDFCTEKNLLSDKHLWLKQLQDIYEKSKDYENAYNTTKQIILNSEELKSQHKEFNISQILVNKEEEILELENKNRITQLQKDELKQFAYIVTHDLKTPLSNISKFAGLFKRKYEDSIDEKGAEYLQYVTDSAQELYTMLSALFQYISIEKDDNATFEPCKTHKLISSVLKTNLIPSTQYNIELNGNFSAPIRDFHLEIIMQNLINNAIKFKREDRDLFIDISIEKNDQEFLFKVSDNGIGIDDQYQHQIFEIFKRLNKNNSIGTGIGLSICKKIVQNYIGKIWAEDNNMGGTTFCFTLKQSD